MLTLFANAFRDHPTQLQISLISNGWNEAGSIKFRPGKACGVDLVICRLDPCLHTQSLPQPMTPNTAASVRGKRLKTPIASLWVFVP